MKKMKMTIFKNVGVSEIDVIILHCAFFMYILLAYGFI